MTMKGWKRMILGEKMPDKDDPKYRERYEKEVGAGRRFARWLKLDKAAACAQAFALHRPRLFLALVFGVAIGCMAVNVSNLADLARRPAAEASATASERQERMLQQKRLNIDKHDIERETD